MAVIPLTQGKYALVDDADYAYVSQWKWSYSHGYAVRQTGGRKNPQRVYLHRVIAAATPGQLVDHLSGDSLDNRRSNLRIASKAQNNANAGPRKDNKSGYRWVCQSNGKWLVQLKGFRRTFTSLRDAVIEANTQAIALYGEFAYQNEVPE